jgi:magnesium-transporting ATPase (P-type)
VTSQVSYNHIVDLAYFAIEKPNSEIQTFSGTLSIPNGESHIKRTFNSNNMLFKGEILRKTDWIFGIVLYTGNETKIAKSSGQYLKHPIEERNIMYMNAISFFVLLVLSILSSITYSVSNPDLTHNYLKPLSLSGGLLLLTFLVIFNGMIPMGLSASLTLIKHLQSRNINQDRDLSNTVVYDSKILSDLGRASYLFADKTGTLTKCEMSLRYFSIGGLLVNIERMEVDEDLPLSGSTTELLANFYNRINVSYVQHIEKSAPILSSIDLKNVLENSIPLRQIVSFFTEYFQKETSLKDLRYALEIMALCHTVTPLIPDHIKLDNVRNSMNEKRMSNIDFESLQYELANTNPESKIIYESVLPEEGAILHAMRELGIVLHTKVGNQVTLKIRGKTKTYRLLNVIEYSSERRRMSVIYKIDDGKVVLICKGADDELFKRGRRITNEYERELRQKIEKDVKFIATQGFRTLIYGVRELEEQEYLAWQRVYEAAKSTINDRDLAIENASNQLEYDLKIIAGVGLEDRIQEKSRETIEQLTAAGLNFWIVSGDKKETVVSCARSIGVITPTSHIIRFDKEPELGLVDHLDHFHNTWDRILSNKQAVIVIDGEEFKNMKFHEKCIDKFLVLCSKAKHVVCCRMSPAQKGELVQIVKKDMGYIQDMLRVRPGYWPERLPTYGSSKDKSNIYIGVIAIGDGSNDIPMLNMADVGIGIIKNNISPECDIGITRFKHLTKLILVHGHLSYFRTSTFVLQTFYRYLTLYLCNFVYQILCGYTGTSPLDSATACIDTFLWTFLITVVNGTTAKDHHDDALLENPSLYKETRKFDLEHFGFSLLASWFHSLVIVIVMMATFESDTSYYLYGSGVFTAYFLVVSLRTSFFGYRLVHPALFLTLVIVYMLWIGYQFVYQYVNQNMLEVYQKLLTEATTYLKFSLAIVLSLIPDLCVIQYRNE